MFSKILASFILVLLIDLFILIKLGEYIGFWYTIAIIIIAGIVGAVMVMREGLSVIQKVKKDLGQGVIPGRQLLSGLLVLIGGMLLIAPGIITDVAGFMLIIPGSRDKFVEMIISYLRSRFLLGRLRLR